MRAIFITVISMVFFGGICPDAKAIATADNSIGEDDPVNHGISLDWNFIYKYKNSSAAAVDHFWMLTAAHVADDSPSGNLMIDGEIYTQQEIILHPEADLALVRFDKPFPGYYPLHDGEIHNGKKEPQRVWDTLVFSGYGRTGMVTSASFSNGPGGNGTKRWGTNRGFGYNTYLVEMGGAAGTRETECFITLFNLTDTAYEAGAAQYDSGGPVFIERNGDWYIAGISILLLGSDPFTGNAMAEISRYRDWIIDNIPNYDTDMDGLPDWYETQYAGDTSSMSSTADWDDDDFTNYEEWIADTMPDDNTSYLRILSYTNANEVVFSSSTERQYRIEYRTNLADTNEAWQTEVDWFMPVSTQTVQAISTAADNRLFRLSVKLP